MRRLFFIKKTSLFYLFLMSNILTLIIPITIGSISHFNNIQLAKEQAKNYSLAMLDQTCQVVDGYLSGVDQLMTNLMMNVRIQDFLDTKTPLTLDDKYNMIGIVDQISKYKNSNIFVKNIYVYYKKSDIILTGSTKYSRELFFKNELLPSGLLFDEWNQLHDKIFFRSYIPLKSYLPNKEEVKYIACMQSLPMNEMLKPTGMAVVLIDAEKIRKLIQNINLINNGLIFILDDNNKLIISYGNQNLFMPDMLEKISSSYTYFFSKVNNTDVMVSHTISSYNHWEYISILPTNEIMKKVNIVRNNTIVIIILEIFIGLCLALLLAKKNYGPIKRLVESLMQKRKINYPVSKNELSFIEEVTWQTMNENEKVMDEIEKQKPLLKSNFLRQLIYGDTESIHDIHDASKAFDIIFQYDYFCVFIIHIDTNTELHEVNAFEQKVLNKFIITNMIEELINKEAAAYAVDSSNDNAALIVNLDMDSPETINRLCFKVKEAKEYVMKISSAAISFGIGNIYKGIKGIHTSYNEANSALEYRFIRGNGTIMAYRDIPYKPNQYIYPVMTENEIINSVKIGDISKVIQILNDLFKHIMLDDSSPIEMVKLLVFNITSTAFKVLSSLCINEEIIFEKEYQLIMRMMHCETVNEMYDLIKTIYVKICEYINSNKKSHNDELKGKIAKYISDKYADRLMNLNTMAMDFHMNPSYLSTFFKEQFGKNFIDFISEVRIEEAKELLAMPSLTIDEIAQRVGYASDDGLNRVFKKYLSITTGQYRKHICKI